MSPNIRLFYKLLFISKSICYIHNISSYLPNGVTLPTQPEKVVFNWPSDIAVLIYVTFDLNVFAGTRAAVLVNGSLFSIPILPDLKAQTSIRSITNIIMWGVG